MNTTKVFFGMDIPISDQLSIIQPTVNKIIDIGEVQFSKYVLPFVMTLDFIFEESFDTSQLDMFELFFEKGEGESKALDGVFGKDSVEALLESIVFFSNATMDDIKVMKHRKRIIIKDYVLSKENFAEFRKVIQAICVKKDIEAERPPKNMSKRQADIWNKIQAGRKRKALKESVKIEDMANFICHCGQSYIDPLDVLKMKYYQFHNAYLSVVSMDSYHTMTAYKLSQKYDFKDDVPHWTKTMKLNIEL